GAAADLALTVPFNLKRRTLGEGLACIGTVGRCTPALPAELNCTLSNPLSPGFTGVLVQSGVVQPQEACTLEMTKGACPTLVNSNSCSTTLPSVIVPKSNSVLANSN